MNYLTTEETVKFSKEEILIQCVLGIASCKTNAEVVAILDDVWEISRLRINGKKP